MNYIIYIIIAIFIIVLLFPQSIKICENFGSIAYNKKCNRDIDCISGLCAGSGVICKGGTGNGKCAQISNTYDYTRKCTANFMCASNRCAGLTGETCSGTGRCAKLPQGMKCDNNSICVSNKCINGKCT